MYESVSTRVLGMCNFSRRVSSLNIPEIMTFKECQQLLKVGKNTLLDLLHTRQISGFKIGTRWKIPKESVVEFIQFGG